MKVVQINVTVNSGSTGRIAEDIGKTLLDNGHESWIAYGRGNRPSQSQLVTIGNQADIVLHGAKSLLFDRHGFGSKAATISLINEIKKIQPDVICLHNLHGYYIHIGELFEYLSSTNIPTFWTFFDCWAFTGHCSYFDDINCTKWKTECYSCPKTSQYPKSLFKDQSTRNFRDKKALFLGKNNLHLIVHSQWLKGMVEESFMAKTKTTHIFSGIDLGLFKPSSSNLRQQHQIHDKTLVLGVASVWDKRKGLQDFGKLVNYLDSDYQVVLIGVTDKQRAELPNEVIGISRTESVEELAQWYSAANVFVNPTYQDNFPTTNIESLACGTPVVTYQTGGSPEAIDQETGMIVEKGSVKGLKESIELVVSWDREEIRKKCRLRAEVNFDKSQQYLKYIKLFEQEI